MSNVSLTIGGRVFTVACAEGEETHVAGLGRMIHEKVATMCDSASQSDVRMLLFAALLLADELADARTGAQTGLTGAPILPQTIARAGKIAERLEKLAERLEG